MKRIGESMKQQILLNFHSRFRVQVEEAFLKSSSKIHKMDVYASSGGHPFFDALA